MSRSTPARRATRAATLVACAAVLLAGCVTETGQEPRRPATIKTSQDPGARGRKAPSQPPRAARNPSSPARPNDLTDPCAARMHDLSGFILMYYAVNKRLPERVEELEAFATADVPFSAECPVSGRPYVYAPGGLQSVSGVERYLILYDAAPSHAGLRWGVFVAPPRGGQPPATWVILMSDEVFRGYVPGTR